MFHASKILHRQRLCKVGCWQKKQWILMNPHGLHRPTMFHMFQYICHVLYAVLWSCMTVFFEKLFHGL